MKRSVCQVRIDSYFSLPTDLATIMVNWPEFVRGDGYHVELESEYEDVIIDLVPARDDDTHYVTVRGEQGGRLFLAALGIVTYAMAGNSDEVRVCRWNEQQA